ncbi:MAG TPA: dockerin type I domain-containing protein, partial [Allocoleopsis sp.]
MNQGLPNATLAMHLSISNNNRKLRVATHGVGVYECDLLKQSDFLNKINYVRVLNQLETKPNSVNATYYLQSNPSNLSILQKNGASAQLDLPANIEIPTITPPQYPYPGNSSNLNHELYPFKIAIAKTDGASNAGVTTYDISVISKHILGQQLINSPYKLLAADVDSSGEIDAADMLLIRQVVLRIEPNFKKVPNWIFVPKSFNLPASPKLSDVPNAYFFNAYSANNPDTFRFVAIKAGDVNESATAFLGVTERREAMTLSVDNQWLEKDKIYDILIKIPETSSVLGIQGALLTEGASILDISSPILSDFSNNNFHILNKNQATFSWNNENDVPIMDNQTLFIVKIKADKSGELKNILKLNQDILNGEIYAESDLKNG